MKSITRTNFLALLSIMAIFLSASSALAAKPLTPDSIAGGSVVDDAWVNSNYQKAKVYDVRKKAEYVESHIPGAISAPYKEKSKKVADFDGSKDKLDLGKFPSNKNETIIVHCNGARCWKSYKAAVTLINAGYTNVKWYRDGFPGWTSKGFPVE